MRTRFEAQVIIDPSFGTVKTYHVLFPPQRPTEEGSSGEEENDIDEETMQVFEFIANHLPRNEMLPLSRKLGIEQTIMEDIEYR